MSELNVMTQSDLDDLWAKIKSRFVDDIGFSSNKLTWKVGGVAQTALTIGYATNAGTATKLGSATVGASNRPIYLDAGTATAVSSVGESYLSWGGKDVVTSYPSPVDCALVPELRNNVAAFIPADHVTIEYSRDGGATWLDYEATDAQKTGVFTSDNFATLRIGKESASTGVDYSGYLLRITLDTAANIYRSVNKFVIRAANASSTNSPYCTIETRTQEDKENNTDTWTTRVNKSAIRKYYNTYNVDSFITYYSGNTKTTAGQIRFTFGFDSYTSEAGLIIYYISIFARTSFAASYAKNNMVATGHLYSFDTSQNATFPANVSATTFYENGTALSSKYAPYNANGYLPLNGGTLARDANGVLFIQRNSTSAAAMIGFKHYSSGTTVETMGYIGMWSKDAPLKRWNGDASSSYKIWDEGNDGSGSGLDADLLDGQHGSYYAAASALGDYLPLAGGTMTGSLNITIPANTTYYYRLTGSQYAIQMSIGTGNVNRGLYDPTTGIDKWLLYFDASNTILPYGNVGIGTTSPDTKLHVNGNIKGTQIISTAAQGTAPFTVTSNTLVANLNADLLDGQEGSYYQPKVSALGSATQPIFISGSGTFGTCNVDTQPAQSSANLITSGAVWKAIDDLPEPMVMRGTLGTNGTITSLPTASASNEGDTYKVITAGTYAGQAAKVGDTFVSYNPSGTTNYSWLHIPSGDDIEDTWRNIKVNGTEKLATGISSGAVDFVNGTNTNVVFNATGNKIQVNTTGEVVHPLTDVSGTAAVTTSGSRNAAIWEGTADGVTSLYTGLMVTIKVPVAGNADYGTVLKLNDGDEHPVCANVSTAVSTRYAVNCIITLIYDNEQTASAYKNNASKSYTGVWKIADYDSTIVYRLNHNYASCITTTNLYRQMLLLQKNETTYVPINAVNGSTATTKTLTTESFNPFGNILYYFSTSSTGVNAGTPPAANYLSEQYLVDLRFSFNTGQNLTAHQDVYIVASPQSDGTAKLYSSPITQTLPTTDGDLIYIYLGTAYDTYRVEMFPVHPVYWHKDGKLVPYSPMSANALRLTTVSKTAWGKTFWTADGVPDSISGDMRSVGSVFLNNVASLRWKKNGASSGTDEDYLPIMVVSTDNNLYLGPYNAGKTCITNIYGKPIRFYTKSSDGDNTGVLAVTIDADKNFLTEGDIRLNNNKGIYGKDSQGDYKELLKIDDTDTLGIGFDMGLYGYNTAVSGKNVILYAYGSDSYEDILTLKVDNGVNIADFNGKIVTPNNDGIEAMLADGSGRAILAGISTGNIVLFGDSSYQTRLRGSSIAFYSGSSSRVSINSSGYLVLTRYARFGNNYGIQMAHTGGSYYDALLMDSNNKINIGNASVNTLIKGSDITFYVGSAEAATIDANKNLTAQGSVVGMKGVAAYGIADLALITD